MDSSKYYSVVDKIFGYSFLPSIFIWPLYEHCLGIFFLILFALTMETLCLKKKGNNISWEVEAFHSEECILMI